MSSQPSPYTNLSTEVQTALNELNADNTRYEAQNANELIKLENSVQIFFLTSDGKVSTFSAPETLRIFQFHQDSEDSSSTFLQVGGWTHPLIPGASPCLQAENGAIMFPDIYSDLPNCSVGLVLIEGISEDTRNQLMSLLDKHTALKSQTLLPPDQRLGAIGSAIVKGAEYLSQGIEIGAEKAGELIEYVTEISQVKLSKAEEDAKVGSLTRGSINAAKSATTATVKVSGYVANRVGKLTKSMAGYLASKAEKPLSGVVASTGGDKKQGTMAYVVDAARGSLIAYGTVYNGLETSAKVLGKNMKENSVKVVSHKYGGEAGNVFGDACTAAGNAAMTYMNIQSLGVKGLVKKTAKETGKTVAKNVINGESRKSVTNEPTQPTPQQ
eukprot:GFUD01005846.1.p1 GENE.GFUD01005846.1~~GFUD01005846.1.p1  ORF type:complete len:384 (+),score=95.82 GFUD01005846.1:182-1333(+)